MLRILIADDHPIFREGIKKHIDKEVDLKIEYEATDGIEAYNMLLDYDVDVVILDLEIPGKSGLEILTDIKKIKPKLPILIFSMHPEERYGVRAFKAGASGYLSKEVNSKTLIQAIHTVSTGRKYITPALAEKLATEVSKDSEKMPHELLSNREFEIMRMIALGKSVREIADELNLSVNTINTYRSRILEKMNMKTNMEIAYYAIKSEIID